MSKVKNPQEKKRLSLSKDRRNCYGENDKSSRKNIKRNKVLEKKGVRAERRKLSLLSGSISEDEIICIESEVISGEKYKKVSGFKKYPDQPLSEHIKTTQRGKSGYIK